LRVSAIDWLEWITIAMVLLQQVIDQPEKEDPEHVQHDLGEVDVLRNRACFHGAPPTMSRR
jgi:hypothetical protein